MGKTKYGFDKITEEIPAFYPWLSPEDEKRLKMAAHMYNYRHKLNLRVRRGHRDGAVGVWVTLLPPDAITQELVEPKPGEIAGSFQDKTGFGKIHYHGSGFIPMRHEPDSDAMRDAVAKLMAAKDRYERRHGIRIIMEPKIYENQFGYWGKVDRDPEVI